MGAGGVSPDLAAPGGHGVGGGRSRASSRSARTALQSARTAGTRGELGRPGVSGGPSEMPPGSRGNGKPAGGFTPEAGRVISAFVKDCYG